MKNRTERRAQGLNVFKRHRQLTKANDKLQDRNGWKPEWKTSLDSIKPYVRKG